jgi:hypothetical protein
MAYPFLSPSILQNNYSDDSNIVTVHGMGGYNIARDTICKGIMFQKDHHLYIGSQGVQLLQRLCIG